MLENFINNAYVASASSDSFDLVNPATGQVTTQSPNSTAEDVKAAYAAARAASKTWGRMTPGARQLAMLRLADAIEAHGADGARLTP